jgi:YaiO family outer membrane protein
VTRRFLVALTAGWLAAAGLRAQTLRVAGWGSLQDVTASDAWSTAGAQVTLVSARGHTAWVAGEFLGRFGTTDATERLGGVFHPDPRWWITVEAGTAARPAFMPRNTWEADVTALVKPRASLGLGYRRWNYGVGPVDIVIPHITVPTRTVSWDLRAFVSRNPSRRTDAAFSLRATAPLARRAEVWALGAAGHESYLVGTAPAAQVRSLETLTGAAGLRYNAGSGFTVTIDAEVVRSRPVLSRRGARVGVYRQF